MDASVGSLCPESLLPVDLKVMPKCFGVFQGLKLADVEVESSTVEIGERPSVSWWRYATPERGRVRRDSARCNSRREFLRERHLLEWT